MTQTAVTIPSAGLKLSGVVHVPDDVRPGERRAAFLVLHGFGSNKSSSNTMEPTKMLDRSSATWCCASTCAAAAKARASAAT